MALRVTLRFYAELGDFLPPSRRQVAFDHTLPERDAVKDVLESLGVPHTEVDLIVVNGESVDFAYQVRDGDRIAVYPLFRSLDITEVTRVRPPLLPEPRFVLDTHLGRLAGHLRMLGFDTLYRNDYDDAALARISATEQRILLTRDRGLLKRNAVTYGCHVWATDPDAQLIEVVRRFQLAGAVRPFTRCMRCNGLLEPVDKTTVEAQLEPKTRLYYETFARCRGCGQVYWKGSHYQRLARLLDSLTTDRPAR